MHQDGERKNSSVIPSFNRTVRIDFRGAKISSDAGVLMLRGIDERFNITAPFENEILGNEKGLAALDETLQRSIDVPLRKKGKGRLILDMDSTEEPAHGRQEGVAYNGQFEKNCYHPL